MTTPEPITEIILALEKALTAATPGEWTWEQGSDPEDMPHLMSQGAEVCNFGDSANYYPTEGSPPSEADAAYIVACSPLTIRTLLDAHASALRDADRYRWLRANREEQTNAGTMIDCFDEDGALLHYNYLDKAVDACIEAARADLDDNTKGAA